MKKKSGLVSAVMQLIIGVLGVAGFVILAVNGQEVKKWIIALVVALLFIVMGVYGIWSYRRK